MISVILSGGSGTRLWPMSRSNYPKQFSDLFKPTLMEQSIDRVCGESEEVWVVTNRGLEVLTHQSFHTYPEVKKRVLGEPVARNTAPAILYFCRLLELEGRSDEVVAVFPADHLVKKPEEFRKAIRLSAECALNGKIVTVGIEPTYPATGFGYIQTKDVFKKTSQGNALDVGGFKEKPHYDKAKYYVETGQYYWNAGVFVFRVKDMLTHFKDFQKHMWQAFQGLDQNQSQLDHIFQSVQSISIDYAIMEKIPSRFIACVPCDCGWSDVGSWDSVAEINQFKSEHPICQIDGKHNYVIGRNNQKLFCFIGLNNLNVIDTEDVQVIFPQGLSQRITELTDEVKKTKPELLVTGHYDRRPWGQYSVLKDTVDFKSKVIEVEVGQQLSYQSHKKREEHWIVTKGQGEVVLNDQVIPVERGKHIHIPFEAKHRIKNTGDTLLQFVEVQLGDYFGEDDIIRYEDDYHREK